MPLAALNPNEPPLNKRDTSLGGFKIPRTKINRPTTWFASSLSASASAPASKPSSSQPHEVCLAPGPDSAATSLHSTDSSLTIRPPSSLSALSSSTSSSSSASTSSAGSASTISSGTVVSGTIALTAHLPSSSGNMALTASPNNPFAPSPSSSRAYTTTGSAPYSLSRASGKHRLSPSPSPSRYPGSAHHAAAAALGADEDFVMISPIRGLALTHAGASASTTSPHARMRSDDTSSSPVDVEESPTPACGMASAAARLRLGDDDSPIRRGGGVKGFGEGSVGVGVGMRRGCPPSPLKFGVPAGSVPSGMDSPDFDIAHGDHDGSPRLADAPSLTDDRPPPPLFPLALPRSSSQELRSALPLTASGPSTRATPTPHLFAPSKPVRPDRRFDESKVPRLSASHPLRARSSTGTHGLAMDSGVGVGVGVGEGAGAGAKSILSQKKAVSLDRIPMMLDKDEAFGSVAAPAAALGHARRTSKGHNGPAYRHKRMSSGDGLGCTGVLGSGAGVAAPGQGLSRSTGQKSNLHLSLNGLPDFSYSGSSLASSLSAASTGTTGTTNMTPPASAFSPAEPPIFEDVKPLQEAFEQPVTALRKFKPRDSGVAMGDESAAEGVGAGAGAKMPPSSVWRPSTKNVPGLSLAPAPGPGLGLGLGPRRPPMLKRTSSMGDERVYLRDPNSGANANDDERPLETPIEPSGKSGWPTALTSGGGAAAAFAFLGDEALAMGIMRQQPGITSVSGGGMMPNTPVKKGHFPSHHAGHHQGAAGRRGMAHSSSQPSLSSGSIAEEESTTPLEPSGVPLRDVTMRENYARPRMSLDGAAAAPLAFGGGGGGHRRTRSKGKLLPLAAGMKVPLPVSHPAVDVPEVTFTPSSTLTRPGAGEEPASIGGNTADLDADMGMGSSPTVRVQQREHLSVDSASTAAAASQVGRVGMLRRESDDGSGSGSESVDASPTRLGGDKVSLGSSAPHAYRPNHLAFTPSKPPAVAPTPLRPLALARATPSAASASASASASATHNGSTGGIYPRLSLPAFTNPKLHRTLHHRQSHPATQNQGGGGLADEDIFESRFITLETLGKGAFSTVVKVQERNGEGLWAVKKARGVFDGVRDRLRHLEEVDILRHLSNPPSPHVIQFESAWEQNRQLYIQTELCLGTLAFFLEEYGRVVERLDEGRVWKIVRELSDGVDHIHRNGAVHFDLKPANILISSTGTLKIGDFGMASRVPRVHPARILEGSGLGLGGGMGAQKGSSRQNETQTQTHTLSDAQVRAIAAQAPGWDKLEREGDRVYMPPEMLRGVFGMSGDIFSFGLIILEVSTNICVPDGGPAWHSLRQDDFSVVDLSPLSPALADLVTSCMAADPCRRPTSADLLRHPVIERARTGGAALAPETKEWLVGVLGGYGYGYGWEQSAQSAGQVREGESGGDVEMSGA